LDHVLDSIDSSLILNVDDSLIVDDVRIRQFKFPGIIKAGVTLSKKPTDLPYFIAHKDYLFLSMNPETLAHVVKKERAGELLVQVPAYKSITRKIPQNANFFFYYDLNSTMPRFISKSTLMSQLLKEYEKGVISLYYNQNKININLSAESSNSNRTTLFPGYPKKTDGINSPVIVADITGGDSKELIYLTDKNELLINDITNTPLSSVPINNDAFLTLLPDKQVLVNDSEGILYIVDGQGQIIPPFPNFSEATDSFPPLITEKGMIFYSSIKEEMQFYNINGTVTNSIAVDKTVFSQPLLIDKILYYYPKSLMGNVYASTLEGTNREGWPRSSMGISFSTPFKAGENIGFLTQKGNLFLWDSEGTDIEGFPVPLAGVYYSTPIEVSRGRESIIAAVNHEGLLTLIDLKGEIISSRKFPHFKGKDVKIVVSEIGGFESPVIFIYGGSNYITAVNTMLQVLPGFPVKGFTRPAFSDINNDGYTEVITAGYDKKLYIYTVRNR